jgi:hypothetical protein
MTVRRLGIGWVDDARTCVVPECGMPAPVEPAQRELPARVAELRQKAEAYRRLAREAAVEADALEAQAKAATLPAFLCGAHRRHLHDNKLAMAWGTGRHDASDSDLIERTIRRVEAHPASGPVCLVCRKGSKYQPEEVGIPA